MDNLFVLVINRLGLLGWAAALLLALGGCGGGQQTTTAHTDRAGAGQAPTVRFTGGSVPGIVYLGIGPASNSLDAYRLSGPLSKAKRLTYSPWRFGINGPTALGTNVNNTVANGIYGLVANRREVLISRVCCDNLGFIDLLNPARHGGLPGTVVGPIGLNAVFTLAPDGRFAHSVAGYRGCRCDALLVRPGLFGSDRVVYRAPHPMRITSANWSANNRLAILVGKPREFGTATYNPEIVLDPGTSMQHVIRAEGPIDLNGIWWGPRGEISYELEPARVVVRSPSGQTRSVSLKAGTAATCWLPNDTIFTVGNSTFGTLNPASGTIRTIGHFPVSSASIGDLSVLDCPH